MIRPHTLAASALLATFMLLPASAPRAGFSISFSTSSGYGSSHGHRYRGHPNHSHSNRGHRGYGSKALPYRHTPRVYGAPGRHVLGAGCRPITERAYDRFGRLILLHRSLCYDRFGRPYVLGGHGGYRR